MTRKDMEYREAVLRECFKKRLECLDVDGPNDMETVRTLKAYGALWHYTHQLLMAEEQDPESDGRARRTAT